MTGDELEQAYLENEYPRWHFWRGLAEMVYASRRVTSPPVIKRSPTWEGLRDQIEAEMRYREERWG